MAWGKLAGNASGVRALSKSVLQCSRPISNKQVNRRRKAMAMNPRQAEKNSREAVEEAVRSATDMGYEATRRTAEQTNEAIGDAGRRTTNATADAMRQNADRANEFWQSGTAVGGRVAEQSMEQFSRVLGLAGGNAQHTLQRCLQNVQAITESTTHLTDGFRDASAEWKAFAQKSIEHNLDRVNALLGCRSFDQCVTVQTELARDNLEALFQSVRRMSEIYARAAEETARCVAQVSLTPKSPG
jgi:hypothetical protein